MTISSKEMDIILGAMESVRGRGTEWKRSKNLDQFAVDNFYLMTLKKTNVELDLSDIDSIKNKSFGDLLFHGTSWRSGGDIPEDMTNVMRGDLIPLFPNLSTITIDAFGFPFSVSCLLDELSSVELPRSLSSIVIVDINDESGFIRDEMDSDLVQKAAAMNVTVELEEAERVGLSDRLTIGL